MSNLVWTKADCDLVGRTEKDRVWVGDVLDREGWYRAYLSADFTHAGVKDRDFPTQAEAKEYIEGCYALWVAAGTNG